MLLSIQLLRALLVGPALLLAGIAAAHEGHDHAELPKTAPKAGATPRLEAATGPFELVALLRQGELIIYLDRFETNTPIHDAEITVETPAGPIKAEPYEGTYHLAASWATAGSHELTFTIAARGATEILTGTLTVTPDAADTGEGGGWRLLHRRAEGRRSGDRLRHFGGRLRGNRFDFRRRRGALRRKRLSRLVRQRLALQALILFHR